LPKAHGAARLPLLHLAQEEDVDAADKNENRQASSRKMAAEV